MPGPDLFYVLARNASEGRRAGAASALGIAGGTVFHTLAVVLGLSSLLLAVPLAYDALRLGGAAYLVYLGLHALLLGVLFNISWTLVSLAVALAASGAGQWGRSRLGSMLQRLSGGVLVGLGVRFALQRRGYARGTSVSSVISGAGPSRSGGPQ